MKTLSDMPASRLFDEMLSDWLTHFKFWSNTTKAPEEIYQQLFDYSKLIIDNFTRRLTLEADESFRPHHDFAIYAFVALMDEIALYSNWSAQSIWQSMPLEYHLWRSRCAGDILPQRIQQLLSKQEPRSRDLAALYLRCLCLGFGTHLTGFNATTHQETCQLLWQFIYQRPLGKENLVLWNGEKKPDGSCPPPTSRRYSDNIRLHLLALAVLALLFILSQVFWFNIRDTLDIPHLPKLPDTYHCPGENP